MCELPVNDQHFWSVEALSRPRRGHARSGRFVEAGRIITGMSAGIDMSLHPAGDRIAQAPTWNTTPNRPFDTSSPDKAGPELTRLALRLLRNSGAS
jgi:hypothetical protein